MERNRFTRIKFIFIIATILLISLSIFSYIRTQNLMQSSAWVNHTAIVKLELETYFSSVKDVESAMRGYLLTQDKLYLDEFDRFLKIADKNFLRLKRVTADNYSQRENLKILERIASERIANMKAIIDKGSLNYISIQERQEFRANRSMVRTQIDKMLDEEDLLLKIRKKSLVRESSLTPFFAAFLMICCVFVLIVSYNAIYLQLKTSNRLRDELAEQNESLEKMNKELESFTYISSHDLQEPLRKIQTFVSRIIEKDADSLSETAMNYLTRTQDSANRMQNLIRDLLAYSRLSAEVFPMKITKLSTIIEEIKNELDEEISARNVSIRVLGNPDVNIIPSQFHQLLINLISNSIKFSDTERIPEITISNEIVKGNEVEIDGIQAEKIYSKITVSDNGIGFDPQYKDRIFKVFQRVHIDQQYAGTGIGLAIVKKIIENHNGFITSESEVGKGAKFTMWIPA